MWLRFELAWNPGQVKWHSKSQKSGAFIQSVSTSLAKLGKVTLVSVTALKYYVKVLML